VEGLCLTDTPTLVELRHAGALSVRMHCSRSTEPVQSGSGQSQGGLPVLRRSAHRMRMLTHSNSNSSPSQPQVSAVRGSARKHGRLARHRQARAQLQTPRARCPSGCAARCRALALSKARAMQAPNPSVERTANGGAGLFAQSKSVAPLSAAHLKRWASQVTIQFERQSSPFLLGAVSWN
jgi:hypothetical protein